MLLASYRKRKALRSYRRTLSTRLRGTYGTKRHYSPNEVENTARMHGLNVDYLCYAFAMYCDQSAFDAYHAARGEACDYETMRHELGERLFDGDTSFNGATLTDIAHPHGAASSECESGGGWFDGGGFDAGGCSDGGGDGGGD